ncbi:MAG: restriction endonuclease [Gammaproteobacteria bacterium]|nr:restriction endonuclease [Gammaproteobacteria bacterium]
MSYLKKINPYVFEELILTALETHGAKIARNHKYSGDGGLDGRFEYKGKRFAIQAKRYKDHVSTEHINELSQLSGTYDQALFVHTGKTRRNAFRGLPSNIQIISGNRLLDLLLARKPLDAVLQARNF